MPMVAEAAFAMLACARIGAIHSVVVRGLRRGEPRDPHRRRAAEGDGHLPTPACAAARAVPYKHLVDESIRLAQHPPGSRRHRQPRARQGDNVVAGRDLDYATLRARSTWTRRCRASGWRRARPSVTSSTRRGTHGQAEGRAARHRRLRRRAGDRRCGGSSGVRAGRGRCSRTSDIGWVVGHSYIVYGPLINGKHDDHVRRPADPPRPRHLVERSSPRTGSRRCSARPRAIRVLKKQDTAYMQAHEPVDAQVRVPRRRAPRRAARRGWASDNLGVADRRQLLADRNRLADFFRLAARP